MPKRILFAEDNPIDRIPVSMYLTRAHKCEVIEVFDPGQACAALEESESLKTPFDVIILDLEMPRKHMKGGEEVLQYMKTHKIYTPVVLATVWGKSTAAREATAVYPEVVKRILNKSFSLDDLWKALLEAVKR
jgi:CheY-like chemotaxis protein